MLRHINKILCLFLGVAGCSTLFSQKHTHDFHLYPPGSKTSGSLYKSIRLLDTRVDTTCMGSVQGGILNRRERVIPTTAFSSQLSAIMEALIDSGAANGELLLQLRRLTFSEMKIGLREFGYCYFRASLYAKRGERHYETRSMDTVIVISDVNVTTKLLDAASRLIVGFIQSGLLKEPANSVYYAAGDLLRLDSIEKRKLPVYNSPFYKDGIYNSYKAFASQVADSPVRARLRREDLHGVKMVTQNGELKKVERQKIYAVVYNGKPFIATEYDYYPLVKVKDDFYYEGKMNVSTQTGSAVLSGLKLGETGGFISPASVHAEICEIKIDHLNGGSIPMVSASE